MAAIFFVAAQLLSSDTSAIQLASRNATHGPSLRAPRKTGGMRP